MNIEIRCANPMGGNETVTWRVSITWLPRIMGGTLLTGKSMAGPFGSERIFAYILRP